MSDLHYGYSKSNYSCTCGKHFGCGDITPEQRAATAARMREKMPDLMPELMRYFLEDFEKFHGKVFYHMTSVGVNDGEFVKSNKGQQINGPVYDYASDMAKRKAA